MENKFIITAITIFNIILYTKLVEIQYNIDANTRSIGDIKYAILTGK